MGKVPKKIFVLDCDVGEGLVDLIKIASCNLKMPVEINLNEEEGIFDLPKDYDIYFIHLSQIKESDLKEVRENQPWSYFVASSGDCYETPNEVRKLFDRVFYMIDLDDIEPILKEKGNLANRVK